MRGKGKISRLRCGILRITPAYAGKSLSNVHEVSHYRDHPRLCGEKAVPSDTQLSMTGSPPPMRGKAFWKNGGIKTARITPAYAGKRLFEVPFFRKQ